MVFAAPQGPRLAAIDWAMAETAMMLGAMPVAMAELLGFRRSGAGDPPQDTVDLGLRGTPNLEALSLVAPDLILSSGYYTFAEPQLKRIAPVFSRDLYVPGVPPFPKVMALLAELGTQIGRAAEAEHARAEGEAEFARLALRAAPYAKAPCILMELGDSRHFRVFGTDSLFGGALEAIGMKNAWDAGTRFAFSAPVPLTRLVDYPQAQLMVIGTMTVHIERAWQGGALWNSLAPVRAGRVHHLPELNGFGGLPSALRFAHALLDALEYVV